MKKSSHNVYVFQQPNRQRENALKLNKICFKFYNYFWRKSMNKSEIIRATAEKAGMSMKDTESILNAAGEVVVKALSEAEKVQVVGFGSFELKERAARTGRNPKTKEAIEIPAFRTVAFKAGKALKDAVSK